MSIDQTQLERMIRDILAEKLGTTHCAAQGGKDFVWHKDASGVASVQLPTVRLNHSNRLDTGNATHQVYTKDLFTLEESPRLGCGMMEMRETTFDWLLDYDEIDYVIEGSLDIIVDGRTTTAKAGEIVLIPKGTQIKFSVKQFARFLYVTYPADWANQS